MVLPSEKNMLGSKQGPFMHTSSKAGKMREDLKYSAFIESKCLPQNSVVDAREEGF